MKKSSFQVKSVDASGNKGQVAKKPAFTEKKSSKKESLESVKVNKPQKVDKKKKNAQKVNKSQKVQKKEKDSDDENISEEEIEVKFELFNMSEYDYHSVKTFLTGCFGAGEHGVNLVGFATLITEDLADHVGTCVKTDGEQSDPFGFVTGVPLNVEKINPDYGKIIESLKTFLVGKIDDQKIKDLFGKEAGRTAIVFHERLINIPGTIAGPLYQQFLADWDHAVSEEPTIFKSINQILLITPTYREVHSTLDEELGLAASKIEPSSALNYYHTEAEFMREFSSSQWEFKVNSGHETADSKRAFSDLGVDAGREAHLFTLPSFRKFVEYISADQN